MVGYLLSEKRGAITGAPSYADRKFTNTADRSPTDTSNCEKETTEIVNQNGNRNEGQDQRKAFFRRAAETTGIVGAAGIGVPAALTAGLTAAGFTSSGVAAGSAAAATQAVIGNVAAGSAFATLQSVGATGGVAVLGPVGIGSAATAAGGYGAYRYYKSGNSNGSDNHPSGSKEEPHKSVVADSEGNDESPGPLLTSVLAERVEDISSKFQQWLHQGIKIFKPVESKEDVPVKVSTRDLSEGTSNEEEYTKGYLVKCNQVHDRSGDMQPVIVIRSKL